MACARPVSMTQRKIATVERWPGGVAALLKTARARGVHLLKLTDDHGETFTAASTSPFKVLAQNIAPVPSPT